MMMPNLARRPFLNTRPVWVVAAVAGLITIAMVIANARLYVVTDRELAERIERRAELTERHAELLHEVRNQVDALEHVPWKSLAARVDAANTILREGTFSWLELLDDVEQVMPYDVRITRIAPRVDEEQVKLELEVVCKTRDDLLEFLQRLIDDPRFSEPTPRSETPPEASDTSFYTLMFGVTYHPQSAVTP